jgi:hypothetical protein
MTRHGHLLSAKLPMQSSIGQGGYRGTAFDIPMIVSSITFWNTLMWMHHISTKPLEHSDVDASYFDKTMSVKDCASELRNAKAEFKDVLDEATSNGNCYEVKVATARV